MKNRKRIFIFCILYVVICFLILQCISGHTLRLINLGMIWAIAVLGVVVILGQTGKISFGGIAFFGLGAYTVADLTTGAFGFQIPTFPALIFGAIVAAIVGCIIGLIILRLNGAFFVFSTICIVQIFYNLFLNYAPLFGGAAGIVGVPPLSICGFKASNQSKWFIAISIILGISILAVERIRFTRLGRSLASVRDDEVVAQSLGVNTFRAKVIAFTITSFLSGLAGGLYAMLNSYVGYDMFTYAKSTNLVVMGMIGGINDGIGALLGALLITVIPEVFRGLANYFRLMYGAAVILLMVFLPTGCTGGIRALITLIRSKLRKQKNAATKKGEGDQ